LSHTPCECRHSVQEHICTCREHLVEVCIQGKEQDRQTERQTNFAEGGELESVSRYVSTQTCVKDPCHSPVSRPVFTNFRIYIDNTHTLKERKPPTSSITQIYKHTSGERDRNGKRVCVCMFPFFDDEGTGKYHYVLTSHESHYEQLVNGALIRKPQEHKS